MLFIQMPEFLPLVFLCIAVALLYAGVGHGGASGYLAAMSLLSVAPEVLRPTALALNVGVSALGTIAFVRAGCFRGRLFWPLALCALPLAYLGGCMDLDEVLFRRLLGLVLCFGFTRLLLPERTVVRSSVPGLLILGLAGAGMGFVSGLIGVGGGVFLTPLAILLGWAKPREAAAISAPFILLNSLAGLAGLAGAGAPPVVHPDFPWLLAVVLAAGWIGARWGSRIAQTRQLRVALGFVLALASVKLLLF